MRSPFGLARTLILCLFVLVYSASAQSTQFTYQGKLLDSSVAPTALYDLQLSLWDASSGGTQVGSTIQISNVPVREGIFTVQVDFGANFPGTQRWLEVSVKKPADGSYTLLNPRQPVTTTPYAVRSLNTVSADSLSAGCVGCVTAGHVGSVNGSAVTGAIPIASVPSGSGNYIQNQNASPQTGSDFNISGNGSANTFNATTQYNIGLNRVLSTPGTDNVFVGNGSGNANSTGISNTFVGRSAGQMNSTGSTNAFFGNFAGFSNSAGSGNAIFGSSAGFANTASNNSFFGASAGQANTSGSSNAFFGNSAGINNTASDNSFFGTNAGYYNTTGTFNAFFGRSAGTMNAAANDNSFFGAEAGFANTGNLNAFFGRSAGQNNTAGENSFFGAEAGKENTTGTPNAFFGRSAGKANTEGSSNAFFGGFAGEKNTTGGNNSYFGTNAGASNVTGNNNAFFGTNAGYNNTVDGNAFFGSYAGRDNTTGSRNAFVGTIAGDFNDYGSNNSALGYGASFNNNGRTFATVIGSGAVAFSNNQIQLGRDGQDTVRIGTLAGATTMPLCINLSNQIAACSPFAPGIKDDEVVALANAVKEQQLQIEAQQTQLAEQKAVNQALQAQIDALTKLVCKQTPTADACKQMPAVR
ncbi:MAG: hypothetical protein IT173_03735 [Acidobacteria bacterium]|nr:hypothetical protein [Acidobacteriota bacterium]